MMFWNRREVFMGYSMQEFNEVCNVLEENKIKYDYKFVNLNGMRGKMGSFGENPKYSTLYYVYVHNKNYEEVLGILR